MKAQHLYIAIMLLCFPGLNYLNAMDISVQGHINETYDDNINASSANPEGDFVTNIMLGITAQSEIRIFDFEISGHTNQQLYADNDENNSNSQDITASLNKDFSENISLRTGDVFQHYSQTGNFDALFDRGGDNTGYISNNFMINLSVYVTPKFFLFGMYNNAMLYNDNNYLSDSILHHPGLGVGYCFNTANVIRLGYSVQLMKYDTGENTRIDSGYAEYEKYFTKQLRLVLLGGYDYIDSIEGQSLSKRWGASLIDDVDENNQLNISYMKENTISNIMNDILDNWRISGNLIRQISNRTVLNMSIFYGEGTYQVSGIKEKLFGASVLLSFIVTDFVNFDGHYVFTWNSSAAPDAEETGYNRDQFSVGFSAVY